MTENRQPFNILGKRDGQRLTSRVLEEQIQQAVEAGHRQLAIHAFGQHGIGGRLWRSDGKPIHIEIDGHAGQRLGSMGYPGTFIEVLGPASDDVGWLNAGATCAPLRKASWVSSRMVTPWRCASSASAARFSATQLMASSTVLPSSTLPPKVRTMGASSALAR